MKFLFRRGQIENAELCIGFGFNHLIVRRPLTPTISNWLANTYYVVKINSLGENAAFGVCQLASVVSVRGYRPE